MIVKKHPQIFSLMLLSVYAMVGATLIAPALPDIAVYFSKTIANTQRTMTIFLIGYAFGQLIYGPLSNRFGRKNGLYAGVFITIFGSMISILSTDLDNFPLFLIGRFFEAIGASAGLVISITIINDFYPPTDVRKKTSLLMLAFAVFPGIASLVGGLITQYISWKECSLLLLLYSFLLIFLISALPETLVQDKIKLIQFKKIILDYVDKFSDIKLVFFALIGGLSIACIYLFFSESPFIAFHDLHLSISMYGTLSFLPFLGTFSGSLLGVRLSKFKPVFALKIAFLIESICALSMFLFFKSGVLNVYTLLIPMIVFCIGHPIIVSTAYSVSMAQKEDKANSSAVVNFVGMCVSVFGILILNTIKDNSILIMPSIFLLCMLAMVLTYAFIQLKTVRNDL